MAEAAAVVRQKETEKQPTPLASAPFAHLPDHTELPEEDGTFAPNFYAFPQSVLLTESLWPILQKLHPDAQFTIGQDSGIYWRLTEPPEKGAITPDWFYIPDVPPTLNGKPRRSYVLWQEHIAPFIVIEFVSTTDGSEWDQTPNEGKFWIYEKAIHAPYYVIYDVDRCLLDVYQMIEGRYQPVLPNERKHFPIPRLGIELGIWHGIYINMELPWLRVWDATGNLVFTPQERFEQKTQRAEQHAQRAEQEAQRATKEAQRAEQETQRAKLFSAKLRELGIDPNEVIST